MACGQGAVRLTELQREGKGPMDAATFLRGFSLAPGTAVGLMPRFKLTIEYDGTAFCGWQFQKDLPSVQGVLMQALSTINGEAVTVIGAGRTDAGVHAAGQVAHVDLIKDWSSFTIVNAINANVRPHRISVVDAVIVPDDFNARFSANRRHYLYRIHNRRFPPALDHNRVWWVPVELDADAMHEAAQVLVGPS